VTTEGRPVRPRKSHGAKRTSRIASDGAVAAVAAEPGARGAGRIRTQPPIRTRGLTKQYGDLTAVDNLDLEVQAGEIFGLLGQNGAGKTTTILMLLGLTEPTAGAARVVGLDPARHPLEVKRRVGYMPDSVGFYPDLTGRQNLRYTARLNGMRGPSAETKMDEVLEQVRLSDRADSRTDTYSRGMLQRLGIADALVKDPEILILDEPTASIDPIGVVEILDLLRALVRDRGIAILLSSHLLNQVQSVCDRIGIFAAGKLIGNGTVADLARRFGDSSARVEAAFEAADNPAEGDRIERILRSMDGVVDVIRSSKPDDPWEVVVRPPDASTRVREAILAVSASERLRLTSLRSAVPSLDDIYRRALEQTGLASEATARRAVA
jgi:ABC-2 type transport system ATP-binding protein